MAEEYIDAREREALDYFRNNTTDPASRGTNVVNEAFVATAGQTVFTLANTLVKNVADTISVNAVTKFKGQDYFVTYGEGSAVTTVTLLVGAGLGESVLISYHYGESLIEREFSRTDTIMPRIVMMQLTASEEFAGLGDQLEDGKGSYINAAYRFEIRSEYATQARNLASKAFNQGRKMRHANLFRVIITSVSDLQNFDYDAEKDCYIWQFTLNIQWDGLFT
jgi:hypothetical protein